MSDPEPNTPSDTRDPDDASGEHPSGSAVDNSGGIEANEPNPDLPVVDPSGGEGA